MIQHNVDNTPTLDKKRRYVRLVTIGVIGALVVGMAWLAYVYIDATQSNARLQEEITNLRTKNRTFARQTYHTNTTADTRGYVFQA